MLYWQSCVQMYNDALEQAQNNYLPGEIVPRLVLAGMLRIPTKELAVNDVVAKDLSFALMPLQRTDQSMEFSPIKK